MTMTAQAIPILSDNYAWLLRDESRLVSPLIVDPAEEPSRVVSGDRRANGGRLGRNSFSPITMMTISQRSNRFERRFGAKVIGGESGCPGRLPPA